MIPYSSLNQCKSGELLPIFSLSTAFLRRLSATVCLRLQWRHLPNLLKIRLVEVTRQVSFILNLIVLSLPNQLGFKISVVKQDDPKMDLSDFAMKTLAMTSLPV